MKADPLRDDGCEDGEPSRDKHGMRAMGPHRLHQGSPARRQGDFLGDDAMDRGKVEALEEGDTFAQGRFEGDIAAHGAFGDRRDMRTLANSGRKFVKTFLADHGRIHVRKQKLLAPPSHPLHDDIDRRVSKRAAHGVRNGFFAGGGGRLEETGRRRYLERAIAAALAPLRLRSPAGAYRRSEPATPDRRQSLQHAS